LAASDDTSDVILAIQTLETPRTFYQATHAIDIGVKVSEAVIVGNGNADTSPFWIRFTVRRSV